MVLVLNVTSAREKLRNTIPCSIMLHVLCRRYTCKTFSYSNDDEFFTLSQLMKVSPSPLYFHKRPGNNSCLRRNRTNEHFVSSSFIILCYLQNSITALPRTSCRNKYQMNSCKLLSVHRQRQFHLFHDFNCLQGIFHQHIFHCRRNGKVVEQFDLRGGIFDQTID